MQVRKQKNYLIMYIQIKCLYSMKKRYRADYAVFLFSVKLIQS